MFLQRKDNTKQKYLVRDTNCIGMTCFQPVPLVNPENIIGFPVLAKARANRKMRACENYLENCPCGEYQEELKNTRIQDGWITKIV